MSKDSSTKCYQDNKEKLQKRCMIDTKTNPKKKQKKKRQYGYEQYKHLFEDAKQRLVKYIHKCYTMSQNASQ